MHTATFSLRSLLLITLSVFTTLGSLRSQETCITYTYKNNLRIEQVVTVGELSFTTSYEFDSAGNEISAVTKQDENKISAAYTTRELVNGTEYRVRRDYNFNGTDSAHAAGISYQRFNEHGFLLCDSFLTAAGEVRYYQYSYRDTLLIERTLMAGKEISNESMDYDKKGRRIRRTWRLGSYERYIEYNYDKAGRLIAEVEYYVKPNGKTARAGITVSYRYNSNGSLASKIVTGVGQIDMNEPCEMFFTYDETGKLIRTCITRN